MKDDDRRLSGAYAADAVNGDERAAHEALIREDPELAEETRSLTEAVAELSKISAQPPPDRLRADVLNAIKSVRPLPPVADEPSEDVPTGEPVEVNRPIGAADPVDLAARRSRRRGAWWGAITAAAASTIVALVVVLGQRDEAPINQAEAVISASDVSSQAASAGDWSATLYLSSSQGKAVLTSDRMPDPPSGKDFQVWLVHDDGLITSAGIMPRTFGEGQEYLLAADLAEVHAVAVSEEPSGGSQQPTTDPFLVIELG